jgi:hypothetical protein
MVAGVFTDLSSLDLDAETAIQIKLGFGVMFILIGLSGSTAIAVRWLSLRMQRQQAQPTSPATTGSPDDYSVLHRRITTLPANPSSIDELGSEKTNKEG